MRLFFAAAAVLVVSCPAAPGQFLESDVRVIHTLNGESAGNNFGWAVADLADVDGDGITDFIVGAPQNGAGGANAGRAYVYSGRTGALLFTFTGGAGEQLGYSVADAGDVNGDGTHDIIAGAFGVTTGGTPASPGKAYIFSGADGSLIRVLTGEAHADRFGAAVASAGDVNNDGFCDVLVGAPTNDHFATNAGRVYVLSGQDGSLIRAYDGDAANALLGTGAALCGDVDGDGTRDHIAGGRSAAGPGKAFVFSGATGALLRTLIPDSPTATDFGWFFVAGAGQVDADGVPDLYVGDFNDNGGAGRAYVYSGATGALLHEVSPPVAGEGVGPGRAAGDIDGDNHTDLIVGHYTSGAGAALAGRARVYSGRTGAVLRTITSVRASEGFGFDCVGLGDVDADGWIDLLVSASTGDRVYVIAGNPAPCPEDLDADAFTGSADLARLLGSWGESGPAVAADLNGDGNVGGADLALLLGAWGVCPRAIGVAR